MKNIAIDFEIDCHEVRTPTDGRTSERKWLIAKTKEVTKCNYFSEFGFFSYLQLNKTWHQE